MKVMEKSKLKNLFGMMILVAGGGIITTIFWLSKTDYLYKSEAFNKSKTWMQKEIKYPEISKSMLAIGVLSMLSSVERRKAIRLTWWKVCKERRREVFCRFFTDSFESFNKTERSIYEEENETYKDLSYMPWKGGHNFASQLIWMFQWYLKRFNFQYFLRIDDDYFLCLDQLLCELPHRPRKGLYWGWIHCNRDIVRVDEGWMILSRDLIVESINKLNTTLLCHPFGDQAVALWLKESKIEITYFLDNERIDHNGLFSITRPITKENICKRYIGLHRSYPKEMYVFNVLARNYHSIEKKVSCRVPDIQPFHKVCPFDRNFIWTAFGTAYRHTPKLCKDNPTWEISHKRFYGRENT